MKIASLLISPLLRHDSPLVFPLGLAVRAFSPCRDFHQSRIGVAPPILPSSRKTCSTFYAVVRFFFCRWVLILFFFFFFPSSSLGLFEAAHPVYAPYAVSTAVGILLVILSEGIFFSPVLNPFSLFCSCPANVLGYYHRGFLLRCPVFLFPFLLRPFLRLLFFFVQAFYLRQGSVAVRPRRETSLFRLVPPLPSSLG